jgi:hypothetical protein
MVSPTLNPSASVKSDRDFDKLDLLINMLEHQDPDHEELNASKDIMILKMNSALSRA